jgi:cysteinyl-tRNA synthetase
MSSVDSPEVERFFETLAFLGFHNLDVERLSRRAAAANAVTSRIGVKGGSAQLLPGGLSRVRDRLVEARAEAQATRDFGTVDALKRALVDAGVEVRMSKDGVELVPGPDFDPARLEEIE